MAGIQAAGSFGAFGGDLSGINQFFQRQAQAKLQKEALASQQQAATQEQAARLALAQMNDATARRGQDINAGLAQGQLGLGRERLGLDRELGQGNLALGQNRLQQQGAQFNTGQNNDLEKFFAGLAQSKEQFDTTQDFRNRSLQQEGDIQNRKLGNDELSAEALNALRNAQTTDIGARRAIDELLARANERNINSQISDRTNRRTDSNAQFDKSFDRDGMKQTMAFFANVANTLDPSDPNRGRFINSALNILEQMGAGGQAQGASIPRLPEDARFAGGSNEQDEQVKRILTYVQASASISSPEGKAELGRTLGLSQEVIDALSKPSASGIGDRLAARLGQTQDAEEKKLIRIVQSELGKAGSGLTISPTKGGLARVSGSPRDQENIRGRQLAASIDRLHEIAGTNYLFGE